MPILLNSNNICKVIYVHYEGILEYKDRHFVLLDTKV